MLVRIWIPLSVSYEKRAKIKRKVRPASACVWLCVYIRVRVCIGAAVICTVVLVRFS